LEQITTGVGEAGRCREEGRWNERGGGRGRRKEVARGRRRGSQMR